MFDFAMEYLVPKSLQNISLFHLQGPIIGSNIKCLGEYEKSNSVNIGKWQFDCACETHTTKRVSA